MVIAVLAVIWVLALTPILLRKLSERRLTMSVNSFHRQLRGLRRAYPRLVATAAEPQAFLFVSDNLQADHRHVMSGDEEITVGPTGTGHHVSDHPTRAPRTPKPATAAARRRRVLAGLLLSIVGFFALGTIPPLRVLWGLSLLAVAATATYLALLINVHRRKFERGARIVNIRDLREDAGEVLEVRSHVTPVGYSPRTADALEWEYDDYSEIDSEDQFDYDELLAGGR